MCALVTTKHSATKVAGADASEFLDDLKRIGVRFVVGGSHAYREKLSNNYKPRDLDIVVFGEENVAVVREMLEDTGTPYLMNSVKGSLFDQFCRIRPNNHPKLFGCAIQTPVWDFNFKQVKGDQAIFWILRYPPIYFAEHVDSCSNKGCKKGHVMIDWRIGVLMVLKDEVRRRYLRKGNVPDRSEKINNLTEQSKKEMIDFLDVILFKGNRLFAFIFKSLMKKVLKIQAQNANQ